MSLQSLFTLDKINMRKRLPKLYVQFQREEKILTIWHTVSHFNSWLFTISKILVKTISNNFLSSAQKALLIRQNIVIFQDYIIAGEGCSWMQRMKLVIFYSDNVAKTSSDGLKIQGTLKLSICTWQFAHVQVLQISNLRIMR